MSLEKPTTWLQTSIGSLCNLINGRAFKPKEWSEGGLPIIRIQNLNNPNAKYNYFDGDLADKHRIENGDLLFAWSGTPGTSFGAHVWKGETAALNQHIFKIEFIEALIDKRFLRYAINQTLDELISGAHGGVGLRHVTKGKFEATEIAFPPLLEQKVIADKLDTLLAQVENTKARLERIPQILKRFRQSVLATAVSGRLTEEWRKRNNSQFPYESRQLSEIIHEMRNGLSPKPNEDGRGHPILRISSVRPFSLDQVDIRHLEVSEKDEKRYSLQPNDLLFTRYNGSIEFVGVCARVSQLNHDTLLYPDKLIRVRVDKAQVIPEFLEIFAASFEAREYIYSLVKSTSGQKGISGKDLKLMKVALPTVSEQTEIVRQVAQLFAHADRIEQQVNNALTRVNNLTQSILAKAFRGELTEQWRKDNPELISGENSAEALLERIKAERTAMKPAKKTRERAKS